FLEEVTKLLQRVTALTTSFLTEGKLGKSTGTNKHTIAAAGLARALRPMIGHGARSMHLPDFTMAAPVEFRRVLLAGLFDTDGSFSWSKAEKKPQFMANITSTSLRLLQETQYLLRTFGVTAHITPTRTPKGEPCWVLT